MNDRISWVNGAAAEGGHFIPMVAKQNVAKNAARHLANLLFIKHSILIYKTEIAVK